MFYASFVCRHYFFKTGYSKFAFSTNYFRELVFLSFCILCVFCVMSFEFDVMFIVLEHNDYTIYI